MLRILQLSVTILAVLAIGVACGQQEESENSGGGSGEGSGEASGELRIIMEEVPDTDVVNEMLGQFEEQYPEVSVEIEALPYDQMRDRIVSSFLAPEPTYDLIVVDNPWMYDFASSEYLAPLDQKIEAAGGDYNYDDFAEPVREIAEVDGQTYGVPFYNYGLGLIYRGDLFEQESIQPPNSLEELQTAAQTLDSNEQAGIAMQPQRGYKIFEEWANWLFAAGGQIQDEEGNVTLDTPEARAALEKYIETYENSAPPNSLNWAFDEALRATSSGNAAMMTSYNWMLPTLNDQDGPASDLAGEFQLEEFPGGKGVLGAWYWSVPANSGNPDTAWTFTQWITSPERAVERVSMGGAPVRTSVMENEQVWERGYGEEYYTTVQSILEDSAPLADGPAAEEMIQAVGTELNAAVAGQKSVDEAITAAQSQAEEIIEQ